MQQYHFIKIHTPDEIPFGLLLLADETKEAIKKYIYRSDVYLLKNKNNEVIAVCALYQPDADPLEIKNMAVARRCQRKGIGSFLIEQIKKIAKEQGIRTLIVGTGDGSLGQQRFYKRNGFTAYDTRKNFFIKNYPAPVIENGIPLKDMILLKQDI
ncbi:GCN5 family acetyltransferase [Niabella ginsenosidivorans]|uniref:GCN5 family acetyltransferase n=2 Tax=Niabella ginsenosidivorans TaxID=1176587 RepID=A0A1A9I338_9BACT|nr:GCN5 family acetyltransferase [Niabella ginsenosidivorans]